MKLRKSTFKWLVWTLAFFLVTAGLAQGAERCKGKCCQEVPLTSGHDTGVLELSLNPKTPLDTLLPSCHLTEPFNIGMAAVSESASCQDEGAPSCCHLVKAGVDIQALAVQGHFGGGHRLSHVDMVFSIQPREFLTQTGACSSVIGWALQSRAAPVPLYLKNTSFIC